MDKSTFRIISKAGFLIILIGFLMPIIFNQNGFQTVSYLSNHFSENTEYLSELHDQNAERLTELYGHNQRELERVLKQNTENFSIFRTGKNIANIFLYGIFIISCIGVIIFIILLIKKYKISIIFDWIIVSLAILAFLAIFSGITNVLRYTPNDFSVFDIS
jgi:hypothetical protein